MLNRQLSAVVGLKLKRKWSPQQIAGWLKRENSGDEFNQVSHGTIYRSLFIQARGALKKELQECLRSKRSIRRTNAFSLRGIGLGGMPNAVSIRERPASVEDRAVPGHWEGDLIEGLNKSFIATLVERHSRYVMLVKLKDKRSDTVVSALIKQARLLPDELYKSLTWDRGSEMARHQRFTLETNIKVYFCDPSSPWQRGSNENTNRLLRDYFPKGTDLSAHSQRKLDWVARELNERPRKTLDYETPADRFNLCVALTG
jgi:IS30 family transposase